MDSMATSPTSTSLTHELLMHLLSDTQTQPPISGFRRHILEVMEPTGFIWISRVVRVSVLIVLRLTHRILERIIGQSIDE